LKGSGRVYIDVLTRHLPGETEENYEISGGIVSVQPEIQTDHLPNTKLNLYSQTNLFGEGFQFPTF
jgi:hypothetical protein